MPGRPARAHARLASPLSRDSADNEAPGRLTGNDTVAIHGGSWSNTGRGSTPVIASIASATESMSPVRRSYQR